MVYYGVTMHTGNIGGDFYLNFFILAVVEVPAKLMVIATINRTGRKKIHCFCMTVGGVACLCTIFTVLYGGTGNVGNNATTFTKSKLSVGRNEKTHKQISRFETNR